jgi:hypothetical protein
MSLLQNSNAISSGSYDINNSVRLRSSASAYLSRTPAGAGSQTTWTWSGWVKLGALTASKGLFERFVSGSEFHTLAFRSAPGELLFYSYASPTDYGFDTNALFRDPSAWYHIVATFDTTNATATDRMRLYVNGIRQTIKTDYGSPPQNYVGGWNGATLQSIGRFQDASTFTDGYLADINFIDGQALTPSSFGETDTTTGVWKPKAYTGTYGTNGFYLKFSDIATTSGSNAGLGKDFSGNTNYWTTNNISVTAGTTYDAMTDSPTLTSATVANYPTLNPLSNTSTLTEANLTATNILLAGTTMATPTTGKWYFEYTQTTSIPSGSLWVGVASNTNAIADNQLQGYAYASDGRKVAYNSYTSGYGATWTNGDVIGCALDLDNQTITFYKNNTSQGTAFTSITAQPYVFALSAGGAASTKGGSINCGQRPFAYTPPTGFVRLNTYNLPDSTIKKGNTVMDATLYTGNGSTQTITNAAPFKPDLVWIKSRAGTNGNSYNLLYDSIRGAGIFLSSNTTGADTGNSGDLLSSFNSNGFSVNNTLSGGANPSTNGSGTTFVGWQWQAGQGSTSSNTSGSITSTVSVNTTAGFSVVTYTGTGANATVGHGLGVAPSFTAVKCRNDGTIGWVNYHASLGNTKFLNLNSTNAAGTGSTVWNNTSPTSTTIALGTDSAVNGSTKTYVIYAWAEIAGFSKISSYTGNGSADGPFVYTGFRPKFILVKNSSSVVDWIVWDSARNTFNPTNSKLSPNTSGAEYTDTAVVGVDFLSNGFKLKGTDSAVNGSGDSYIYMAFAENPFKNSLAR